MRDLFGKISCLARKKRRMYFQPGLSYSSKCRAGHKGGETKIHTKTNSFETNNRGPETRTQYDSI